MTKYIIQFDFETTGDLFEEAAKWFGEDFAKCLHNARIMKVIR